jgi:hypothetical protein
MSEQQQPKPETEQARLEREEAEGRERARVQSLLPGLFWSAGKDWPSEELRRFMRRYRKEKRNRYLSAD